MSIASSTNWKQVKSQTNRTGRKRTELTVLTAVTALVWLCSAAGWSDSSKAFAGLGGSLVAQPDRDDGGRDAKKVGWSIVVGSVAIDESVDEAQKLASDALERVHTKGRLADAKLEKRGRSFVIFYGNYDSPDSERAVKDLERIRAIDIDGARPYGKAYMAPPSGEALLGTIAEYDLRNVRQASGLGAGLGAGPGVGLGGGQPGTSRSKVIYTLQVGVYGNADASAPKPEDLKEFRAAAEKAAVQLRREGEMAFYYHAATLSSVTVGLFEADELTSADPRATPGQTVDTPELAMLRKLHPNNLLNGQGIVIKRGAAGETGGSKGRSGEKAKVLQPSFLVEVPK